MDVKVRVVRKWQNLRTFRPKVRKLMKNVRTFTAELQDYPNQPEAGQCGKPAHSVCLRPVLVDPLPELTGLLGGQRSFGGDRSLRGPESQSMHALALAKPSSWCRSRCSSE